tara:strand:- start:27777 stop:28481 length:705 start_codon:yes stop_codon:yes gene_type:complete
MKILILTTETPHHIFFLSELLKVEKNITVISENSQKRKKNFQSNFFLKREEIENRFWFKKKTHLSDFTFTKYIDCINSDESLNFLGNNIFDLAICFGTKILNARTIDKLPTNLFNLHGGDPENYRGLDSHLWSMYHKDIDGLVSTLHHLTLRVDCGEIYSKEKIILSEIPDIFHFQIFNTQTCAKLSKKLIKEISLGKKIKKINQKNKGRYYSSIPSCLIVKCIKNFELLKKND